MNYLKINFFALISLFAFLLSFIFELLAGVFHSFVYVICFVVGVVLTLIIFGLLIPLITEIIRDPGAFLNDFFVLIFVLVIGLFTILGILLYVGAAVISVLAYIFTYIFTIIIPVISLGLSSFFDFLALKCFEHLYLPIYKKMIIIPGYYNYFDKTLEIDNMEIFKNVFVTLNFAVQKFIRILINISKNGGYIFSLLCTVGLIAFGDYDATIHGGERLFDYIKNDWPQSIVIIVILLLFMICTFFMGTAISATIESFGELIDDSMNGITSFDANEYKIKKEKANDQSKNKMLRKIQKLIKDFILNNNVLDLF